MEKQRNVSHMKEQNKAPEKELNKMETSNLPDVEFRTLIIRILNELRERVGELSENFNKEIDKKHKNGIGKQRTSPK